MPKEMTNKKDPIVQSNANFLGLSASTGNMKKLKTKQKMEAAKQHPKPTIFSNLLNLNHEGSCCGVGTAGLLYVGRDSYRSFALDLT